jgi:transposase-like protein
VSYNQSGLDAYLFLKEVRRRYGRKPVWKDEGVWYPEACSLHRLEHHIYPVEWKNLIERMNQMLKVRLETFDDLFPYLKEECDHDHVRNWISVFRFFHKSSGRVTTDPRI